MQPIHGRAQIGPKLDPIGRMPYKSGAQVEIADRQGAPTTPREKSAGDIE